MKFKSIAGAILCPAMMLLSIGLHAQEQPAKKGMADAMGINAESIKKDSKGNVITNQQFADSLNTGKYLVEKVVQDNKITEAKLKILSEAQLAKFRAMMEKKNFNPMPAPDFDVVDMKGKRYKLADLKDKTVVLNFWFKECAPCIGEMPELNELVKANKDVVFIALTRDQKSDVKTFLAKTPFMYNIIPDAKEVIAKYDISAFPSHYIIKNGIITNKFAGNNAVKNLQAAIDTKIFIKN